MGQRIESYKKKYKEGFLENTNIQGTRYGKGLIPCILEREVGVGTIRADKRKYCFEEKWMVRQESEATNGRFKCDHWKAI